MCQQVIEPLWRFDSIGQFLGIHPPKYQRRHIKWLKPFLPAPKILHMFAAKGGIVQRVDLLPD